MNIQERLMQFQGELSQRKHLMENRISILNNVGSGSTTNRVDQLLAAKKELKDIQDLFYDYFYNELTSLPLEENTSNRPASISLDTLLAEDGKKNEQPAAVEINPSDLEISGEPTITDNNENPEEQPRVTKPKPNLQKIIGKVTELRSIHKTDHDTN